MKKPTPVLFIYVVTASSSPDNVECVVPYRVDDKLIFFGPCKRRLRGRLRREYLGTQNEYQPVEDIFLVGVNGSNSKRIRKIIWMGQIRRLMTFETAFNTLTSLEFQEMRSHEYSPLHLEPVCDQAGNFLGYRHISREHEDIWVEDIVHTKKHPQIEVKDKQLLLKPAADRHQVFTRDCCFLCDNIFFACGNGLDISDRILKVLKHAQPSKQIDKYAIFGYQSNDAVEGFRGSWLEISGQPAENLIELIKTNRPESSDETKRQLKPCRCQ